MQQENLRNVLALPNALATITCVTYVAFLALCRRIADEKAGHELNEEECAALWAIKKNSLRNYLGGYQKPGRELLESAAQAAGYPFERWIQSPVGLKLSPIKQEAVDFFLEALTDPYDARRVEAALNAGHALAAMKKPRRKKTGGRTRKKA